MIGTDVIVLSVLAAEVKLMGVKILYALICVVRDLSDDML